VEKALKELEPVFAGMYSEVGRRSTPPEHLLKACLLMAFYSFRSERQFCERLRYDLKWFLGRPCRGKLVASRRRPPCWRGPARRLSCGPSEKSNEHAFG